jgi:hypothetical protein
MVQTSCVSGPASPGLDAILSTLSRPRQGGEFHKALLDADSFEDLPGKWQAAILGAEQNRPRLRRVSDE